MYKNNTTASYTNKAADDAQVRTRHSTRAKPHMTDTVIKPHSTPKGSEYLLQDTPKQDHQNKENTQYTNYSNHNSTIQTQHNNLFKYSHR